MKKIVSIDLEFNRYQEILSSGCIFSQNLKIVDFKEEFYRNKSDKITYKIHGLSNDFLKKYGTYKNNLKYKILKQDYILGFQLNNDLKVLNISANVFDRFKVIDIKLILNSFKVDLSLFSLLNKSNLLDNYKSFLPIHTSIMDSFLTYIFFEHITEFIQKKYNISLNETLILLAKITTYKHRKQFWMYEPLVESLPSLQELLNEISQNDNKDVKTEPMFLCENNNEVLSKNYFVIAKYKEQVDIDLKKIKLYNKNLNIGFKELNYE